MTTYEKTMLVQELKELEVTLLALNKELRAKLGKKEIKKCVVCDRPVDNEDLVHDSCYRREWKDVRVG